MERTKDDTLIIWQTAMRRRANQALQTEEALRNLARRTGANVAIVLTEGDEQDAPRRPRRRKRRRFPYRLVIALLTAALLLETAALAWTATRRKAAQEPDAPTEAAEVQADHDAAETAPEGGGEK